MAGKDLEHFHLHSEQPLALETRRSAYGVAALTPTSRFFVRNNLPMPSPSILDDRLSWSLEVLGTGSERSVSLAELRQLGAETMATVIQCSGNGRKYFDHGPSGSPWTLGAAGCALWTGVFVRSLVEALGGLRDGARYLTSTGADPIPAGVDPESVMVERSVPVEKALEDCLLAWEMNGEPIPLTHGGPLRLIVPGYYGCNNIKYVRRIAFSAHQSSAKIQKTGYRMRPIGVPGSPDQPAMWKMPVKSWVHGPGADGQPVLAGPVQFFGVAFSGGEPVEAVEGSVDGGKTWTEATWLGPDLGRYAFRSFGFSAALSPGEYVVHSRARTADGEQAEFRTENERGYGHDGWRDLGLTVTAVQTLPKAAVRRPDPAPAAAPTSRPARAPAELDDRARRGKKAMLEQANPPCGACHSLSDAGTSGAVGPSLDALAPDRARVEAAVRNGVGAMPAYKETLSDEAISDIAHYIHQATRR